MLIPNIIYPKIINQDVKGKGESCVLPNPSGSFIWFIPVGIQESEKFPHAKTHACLRPYIPLRVFLYTQPFTASFLNPYNCIISSRMSYVCICRYSRSVKIVIRQKISLQSCKLCIPPVYDAVENSLCCPEDCFEVEVGPSYSSQSPPAVS